MNNNSLPPGGFTHVLTLLEVLWNKKLFIAITTCLGLFLGIYILKNSNFLHDIDLTLVPVTPSNDVSNNNGLLGRLSMSLFSSSGSSNFQDFINILKSRMIYEKLASDEEFMQRVFQGEYDKELKKWIPREPNLQLKFRNFIKNILGMPIYPLSEPDADRLYLYISSMVKTYYDQETNTLKLSISMEKENIQLGKLILNKVAETADNILKERSNERVTKQIEFLTDVIEKTQQKDLKMAIINTLSKQYSKKMSGSSDLPFTAEKFGDVYASPKHTHPRGFVVLAVNTFFGFFISIVISILMSVIRPKR